MKKIIVLALFIVLVSVGYMAHAQKQFFPTQIIQLNGDTLKGFILYNNWNKSPERISFSNKVSGENSQFFYANNIKAFSILLPNNKETYNSISSPLDTAIFDLQELSINQEPEFGEKTSFFALRIIEGSLTLLEHTDQKGKAHYFIKEKNTAPTELIYKTYLDPVNTSRLAYNKKYLLQLSHALEDWKNSTPEKLRNTTYDYRSLAKIIKEYNIWKDGETEDNQKVFKKEPLKIKAAVLFGISNTSLNTNNKDESFPNSTNIAGGVSFSLLIPRIKEKWALNNEILYKSYKVDGSITTTQDKDNYSIFNHIYNFKYIKINTLAHFVFYNGILKPYLNAGVSNSLQFKKVMTKVIILKPFLPKLKEMVNFLN
ncbi:MAG: outer membrane beta-barrel protein [Pyrinomonadaceae bacterium]|nr:outer membrane beta-barrel protein [Sphingobacteriaceae bacterium]